MKKNYLKFLPASIIFGNPIQNDDVVSLIRSVLQWMIWIAIPVAVMVIIFAGVMLMTSQGNQKRIDQGKKMLTYAVVGIAIILIGSGFYTLIVSIINLGR